MSIFEFVRSRLDILDVIERYVSLRKMGNYYKGSCPFHKETDASFTVSPDKQIFYCFGCHASGDAISFVSKMEDLTQIESLEILCQRKCINIPDELKNSKINTKELSLQNSKYFTSCKEVALWANLQLKHSSIGQKYLASRGINEDSIERFCIGLFPSQTQSLLIKDMSSKGILTEDLCDIGVISKQGDFIYSPFKDRIIFPIKDHAGRFIGFGGRIYKNDDDRAKYYNSKESEHFLKGQLLFGLDLAREQQKITKTAYLVEGYLDCISMSQHGYKETVATLGTASTKHHLKLISRTVEKLYVLYDGDSAGQKAMLKLAKLCWQTNIELYVVCLPPDQDPASFLKNGSNLDPLLKNAPKIFEFFVSLKSKEFMAASLNQKLKLSREIISVVSKLADPIKRNLLLQFASQQMQLPMEALKKLCNELMLSNSELAETELPAQNYPPGHSKGESSIEEQVFFISVVGAENGKTEADRLPFVINNELIKDFPDKLKNMLKLAEQLKIYNLGQNAIANFLEAMNEDDRNWVKQGILKFQLRATYDHFKHAINILESRRWMQQIKNVRHNISEAQREGDHAKVSKLLNLIKQGRPFLTEEVKK